MNYMAEINAFYDWQEANPLAASSICLWHALMSIANKAGWPESFSTAISTLESHTRYSKDTIYVARNQLRQMGRIGFKERRGRQSAVYWLIPFVSDIPTQTPTQDVVSIYRTQPPTQVSTQPPTQHPTQPPTNNILDYTIQDYPFSGDDGLRDCELARACAKGNADGGNCGKSVETGEEETRQEAARIAERLFRHYFGREATGHDVDMLWEEVARYETQPDGMFTPRIIPERVEVLEYAFRAASESGVYRWDYVRQILSNLAARRLRTRDECEIYDAQREFDKDNRR